MPNDEAAVLARGLLQWIADDVMLRRLKGVAEGKRAAVLRQTREELGQVLCSAPVLGDPVKDVMMRAEIAAAFRATYAGKPAP